jgi:hypothetical protein
MPNPTVRTNDRTLPENIQALAAEFESSWKAENAFDGEGKEVLSEALDRTSVIAAQILALTKTGVVPMRLLARVHIRNNWDDFDDFASGADEVLVDLFRQLGADYPVGGLANAEAAR